LHAESLPNAVRFRFVDAYRILGRYDFKNTQDASRQVVIDRKRNDNRCRQGRRRVIGRPNQPNRRSNDEFKLGGLQSRDGMHLSAVGNSVLACEIMPKLDLVFEQSAILTQAIRHEGLISRYNGNIRNLGYYLNTIDDLRPSATDEQEIRFSTMPGVQQRVFEHPR